MGGVLTEKRSQGVMQDVSGGVSAANPADATLDKSLRLGGPIERFVVPERDGILARIRNAARVLNDSAWV